MNGLVVVGGQWGDEGKGKVVDLLAPEFDSVARYNGGHNAGHTVRVGSRHFALHLIPSGIINEHTRCYLGANMVISPAALVEEITGLETQSVSVEGRLRISDRATLILPTHQALDLAREASRGKGKIGTTGRGIGPAYQDLAQRRALRAFHLTDLDRFETAARALMSDHNNELAALYGADPVDLDAAMIELRELATRLGPMVTDVGDELEAGLASGTKLLFEGAQGILLDILHGSYPYVTSSSCLPAAAPGSLGIRPDHLGPVVAVFKAYCTRVGGGPFPTEIDDALGDRIRTRGNEFGTTTGRPRRCGWFDAVAARYAIRAAGIDTLALTKMDILDTIEKLKICVAYKAPDGSTVETMPADVERLAELEPVYETLPGWKWMTSGVTVESELPDDAKDYITRLEQLLDVDISIISTGPRRSETLLRKGSKYADGLAPLLAHISEG